MNVLSKLVPGFVTLTDAATVALDASKGDRFHLSSASGRTIGIPSNPTDFDQITIRLTNTSGGSVTFALTTGASGAFKFTDNVTALTATAGKTDLITAIYVLSEARWFVVGYSKGT